MHSYRWVKLGKVGLMHSYKWVKRGKVGNATGAQLISYSKQSLASSTDTSLLTVRDCFLASWDYFPVCPGSFPESGLCNGLFVRCFHGSPDIYQGLQQGHSPLSVRLTVARGCQQ